MSKIEVRQSVQHGRGVFASVAIAAGEEVLHFTGPLLHQSQVDFSDYHLQVSDEHYIGPSRAADDYVNHCCEPNAGFRDGLVLVALRDIASGEEITWDYSTAIDEADFAGFPCQCRAANCRGSVTSFRFLSRSLQATLWPLLLPYLKHRYPLVSSAL